jgi:hypothetical protein
MDVRATPDVAEDRYEDPDRDDEEEHLDRPEQKIA